MKAQKTLKTARSSVPRAPESVSLRSAMIVVKVGGGTSLDIDAVVADIVALRAKGTELLLVHGGAQTTNAVAEALGHPPQFVTSETGHVSRRTDRRTLEIFEMVYCGQLNKMWVEKLQRRGRQRRRPLGSRRPHLRRHAQGHAADPRRRPAHGAARRLDRHGRARQHDAAAAADRRRLLPRADAAGRVDRRRGDQRRRRSRRRDGRRRVQGRGAGHPHRHARAAARRFPTSRR